MAMFKSYFTRGYHSWTKIRQQIPVTASVEMKKGMGNAVSNVNSETSRMVAVREPKLRTTANSRTMAEIIASKDDGITWCLKK